MSGLTSCFLLADSFSFCLSLSARFSFSFAFSRSARFSFSFCFSRSARFAASRAGSCTCCWRSGGGPEAGGGGGGGGGRGGGGGGGGGGKTDAPCYDFQNGKCNRTNCRFRHVKKPQEKNKSAAPGAAVTD